eukprot:scaffold6596_cov161-Amphora_coffeaeformis.AAC.4
MEYFKFTPAFGPMCFTSFRAKTCRQDKSFNGGSCRGLEHKLTELVFLRNSLEGFDPTSSTYLVFVEDGRQHEK